MYFKANQKLELIFIHYTRTAEKPAIFVTVHFVSVDQKLKEVLNQMGGVAVSL